MYIEEKEVKRDKCSFLFGFFFFGSQQVHSLRRFQRFSGYRDFFSIRAGLLLGSLLLIGGFSPVIFAQTQTNNTSKNFLQRLRPPYSRQKEQSTVQGAPSGFSEPEFQAVAPAASTLSQAGSSNDGWTPIGTSYLTPSSDIQPDPTSVQLQTSPSHNAYNPSTHAWGSSGGTSVSGSSSVSYPSVNPLISGTGTGNAGVGVGGTASQSTGSASSLPSPFPVDKREFHLPFGNFLSLVPQNQLKEIRLYASRDNGVTWHLYQTINREKLQTLPYKTFPVNAGSDGEFWFAVHVVNLQGQEMPGTQFSPNWRVVVNTTGKPLESIMNTAAATPEAQRQTSSVVSTNSRPQWSPNPDGSIAGGTAAADASSDASGNRKPQNPNMVVFSVKDRSMNSIPDVSLPVYKIPNAKPLDVFTNPGLADEKGQKHLTAKPGTGAGGGMSLDGSSLDDSSLLDSSFDLDADSGATPDSLPSISLEETPESPAISDAETSSDDMILNFSEPLNEEGGKTRYVNDPNLKIEYDVSTVGSSGVGRVELWGTLDDGQTWTYMAEDKDCTSPMNVTLKSDGKYGFQILIFNGAGVGMERPQSGSMPQLEVVLDRINPRVQLYGIQLEAEFGDLEITWGVEDLNLGNNPVFLSWSSSNEGPWRPMTKMPLENTGRYTWRIPDGIPGKVFIRIDVCDLSKNAMTLMTGPVITDVVRPTGVILDAKPAK